MRASVQKAAKISVYLVVMLEATQLDDLDRHLTQCAWPHGIVAVARQLLREDGDWVELRAALWRNRRLESHTQAVPVEAIKYQDMGAVAERFVARVAALFPADGRVNQVEDRDETSEFVGVPSTGS